MDHKQSALFGAVTSALIDTRIQTIWTPSESHTNIVNIKAVCSRTWSGQEYSVSCDKSISRQMLEAFELFPEGVVKSIVNELIENLIGSMYKQHGLELCLKTI